MYTWVLRNEENIPISGDILREKASQFVAILHPDATDLKLSNGWLNYSKFTWRRFGESGSIDPTIISNALPDLHEATRNYSLDDIYNMDETGLFFRMQADHSLATKQLKGRKQDKERITLVLCRNANGTHKSPLWVVGKFEKPRCFKNVCKKSFCCEYRANGKAWMTAKLFEEWLKPFDDLMKGRDVLLLLDNCSAHWNNGLQLKNTVLKFLPPNSTSRLQPLDAVIIHALKAHYRKRFTRETVENLESNTVQKFSILDAIRTVVSAWLFDVTSTTIRSCWRHCSMC